MTEENSMDVEEIAEEKQDTNIQETNAHQDGLSMIFKEPGRIAIFLISIVISLALIIIGSLYNNGAFSDENSYQSNSYQTNSNQSSSTITASGTLYANDSSSIYLTSQKKYYRFTPSSSGYYKIYSSSSLDTYVGLYNSSGSYLSSDDDSGSGLNFSLEYYFYSGSTYYFGLSSTSSGNATIYITR